MSFSIINKIVNESLKISLLNIKHKSQLIHNNPFYILLQTTA